MNIPVFLDSLSKQGIKITAADGQIKIAGSKSSLTQFVIEDIRARKDAIVRFFAEKEFLEQPSHSHESLSPDNTSYDCFREYIYPGGATLRLTVEEFESFVRVVRLLHSIEAEATPTEPLKHLATSSLSIESDFFLP